MRRSELIAIALIILATAGTIVGVFTIEHWRKSRLYTLELIARAPENGNWYPQEFKVPYGKETRILIRNIDTVTHGFTIPDLQVSAVEIKGGQVKVVKFTPHHRGTFPFMCTVWCSPKHMEMRGRLTVE